MLAEILKAVVTVFFVVGVCTVVMLVYRYNLSSDDFCRRIMCKAVQNGEFIVCFNLDSGDNVEYVLRRLLIMTLSKEFSNWHITIVNNGLSEESESICKMLAQSYKCIRLITPDEVFDIGIKMNT